MHIAICDDNIAERKHLERLLSRESDNRIHTTGVLYIDSFGHDTSLMKAPKVYDLFFIDMSESNYNGIDVAERLREFGVTAPIVLCSGKIDYESIPHRLTRMHYISKPLEPVQIHDIIERAIAAKAMERPTVEIRDEENTFYIFPEDIVYAKADAHIVTIHMADGTIRRMLGSIDDLRAVLCTYSFFIMTRKKIIMNITYMTKLSFSSITLQDDIELPLSFGENIDIKKYVNKRNRSLS